MWYHSGWEAVTGEVDILIRSCTKGGGSFHDAIPLPEEDTFVGLGLPGLTGGIKASQQAAGFKAAGME